MLAYVCVRRARSRPLLWVAAVALVAGPVGAVLASATDMTYDGAICGSALSASLERPRDGLALDATQEGCRLKGERTLVRAEVWGVATTGVAVLAALGSAVVPRRAALA